MSVKYVNALLNGSIRGGSLAETFQECICDAFRFWNHPVCAFGAAHRNLLPSHRRNQRDIHRSRIGLCDADSTTGIFIPGNEAIVEICAFGHVLP